METTSEYFCEPAAPQTQGRHFEAFLHFLCMAFAYSYGHQIAHQFVLIATYGWGRVRAEHLYFSNTPKSGPWIVSNTDIIHVWHFGMFLLAAACWIGLGQLAFRALRRLLPRKKVLPQELLLKKLRGKLPGFVGLKSGGKLYSRKF